MPRGTIEIKIADVKKRRAKDEPWSSIAKSYGVSDSTLHRAMRNGKPTYKVKLRAKQKPKAKADKVATTNRALKSLSNGFESKLASFAAELKRRDVQRVEIDLSGETPRIVYTRVLS